MNKQTVVLDFDGVIHSYTSGWKGIDIIPDPPVKGIKEAIDKIREKYKVVVVSARSASSIGRTAIEKYLNKYNIIVDEISDVKPPAIVYVDDRAIQFNNDADTLLERINNFKPWQDILNEEKEIARRLELTEGAVPPLNRHWVSINFESQGQCPVCNEFVRNGYYTVEEKCPRCGVKLKW